MEPGKKEKIIVVVPKEDPFERPTEQPAEPVETPERVEVPA